MNLCTLLERHLDGDLGLNENREFERHLEHCPRCAIQVSLWKNMQDAIVDHSKEVASMQTDWSDTARRALIARVDGRRRPSGVPVQSWRLAFACALVLALGTVLFLSFNREKSDGNARSSSKQTKTVVAEVISPQGIKKLAPISSEGGIIRAPDDGRALVRIGGDRVGIQKGSVVNVVECTENLTRFSLKKGASAWSVAPRNGKGEFVVHAGRFAVRVIGTRFLTDLLDDDSLRVDVVKGAVKVEIPGQKTQMVREGKHLSVNGRDVEIREVNLEARAKLEYLLSEDAAEPHGEAAARRVGLGSPDIAQIIENPGEAAPDAAADVDVAKTVPAQKRKEEFEPSIEQMQQWIIQGQTEKAAAALKEHLQRAPGDREAWSLLADCRRKTGDWSGAVEALQKLITYSPSSSANSARFKAGAILQDNLGRHREAIELFKAYLDTKDGSRPLEVEALMRLARSQNAIGQTADARRTLRAVIEKYDGTGYAATARKMLEEM